MVLESLFLSQVQDPVDLILVAHTVTPDGRCLLVDLVLHVVYLSFKEKLHFLVSFCLVVMENLFLFLEFDLFPLSNA